MGEAVRGLAPGLAEHAPAGPRRDHRGVPGAGCRAGRGAADLARWRGLHRVVGVRAGCGEKRAGLERLGWSVALADHRPFLAHSELEAFFGSPSGLYELLASVLGLEDLTSAATRLAQARLARDQRSGESKRVCSPCSSFSKMPATSGPEPAWRGSAGGPGTWPPHGGPRPGSRWRPTGVSSTGSAASRSSRARRGRCPGCRDGAARCRVRAGRRRGLARWPGAGAGRVADRGAAAPRGARGR